MSEFWQQGVIAFVLAGSIAYLIGRLITWRRRRKACSECKLMKQVTGRPEKSTDKSHAN